MEKYLVKAFAWKEKHSEDSSGWEETVKMEGL